MKKSELSTGYAIQQVRGNGLIEFNYVVCNETEAKNAFYFMFLCFELADSPPMGHCTALIINDLSNRKTIKMAYSQHIISKLDLLNAVNFLFFTPKYRQYYNVLFTNDHNNTFTAHFLDLKEASMFLYYIKIELSLSEINQNDDLSIVRLIERDNNIELLRLYSSLFIPVKKAERLYSTFKLNQ